MSTGRVDSSKRSAYLASLPHIRRSAWSACLHYWVGGCEVTLADGADDGDSQDDHEGAGCEVPHGIQGGEVGDSGRGVRGDRVSPGLRPPGPETGFEAPGGQGAAPRPPKYDAEVVAALEKCWAVANAPAGKRLAPLLGELVPVLRRYRELDIDEDGAVLLVSMSAATIDRRLAPARAKLIIKGRSHTKPGSLLKSRIPMRTWADHDENTPGFVEIDLVGHEGGNPRGQFCFTLTVTDIATGWTENQTVRLAPAAEMLRSASTKPKLRAV
jgi:hypothetical protein